VRTTIDLDEDVLLAAKEVARRRRVSLGRAVSDLARAALTRPSSGDTRNGVPLIRLTDPPRLVTPEIVSRLRDEA
jgi:hypothetical protein